MPDAPDSLRLALVTTYPPDRGNLAEYGAYLSRAFAQCPEVVHVDVIANEVPGAPAREELAAKLTVHRTWKLGSARSVRGIVSQVRRLEPDVVHLNAGIRTWGKGRAVNFMGAALGGMLKRRGRLSVTTLHHIGETMRLDQVQSHMKIDPITRMGMRFASRLYLKADLVTVTLGSMKTILEESFGARNVALVAHGTFGVRVSSPPRVTVPRILTFGFWGAFKDADLLVGAVQELRDSGVPAELVLGGGPHPYFPEIYETMKARLASLPFVRLTGYVPEEKLTELFTSAAVVVLPYRTNSGASGVLNLCRSYGRPVVVSNDYGLLEQLRHEGGSGMVFDTKAALVDALRRVLTDSKLQEAMGEANLEIARRLTIETQAARFVQLFRQLKAEGQLTPQGGKGVAKGGTLPEMGGRATHFEWPPSV